RVQHTDTGKPVIAGNCHFNVSHSVNLIVLAVGERRAIGVDVERVRNVPRVEALARRWLTVPERAELQRQTQSGLSESDAFLRVWSLKEAHLKALGVGISGASDPLLQQTEVRSLDHLLGRLERRAGERGYVGAL